MEVIRKNIFEVNDQSFESIALQLFKFQFINNNVYREYCLLNGRNEKNVQSITDVPFLPIEFFKTHKIISGNEAPQIVFSSSGTTGEQTSKHEVCDLNLYEESFEKCFQLFFGDVKQYCILALLPSYLERKGSSLVYMVEKLMKKSTNSKNGFFLYNHGELFNCLTQLESKKQKTILIGVSFALLDFAEKYSLKLKQTIVMETGGMKGRRNELTRQELQSILNKSFGTEKIYSEYGMTELLSQAYSSGNGIFKSPPWMKLILREINDPLSASVSIQQGAINIIDLANIDSCAFIATSDIGRKHSEDTFEILGRMDASDIRGCNLMIE